MKVGSGSQGGAPWKLSSQVETARSPTSSGSTSSRSCTGIDKYDQRQKIHRVEVEVTHEKKHRQHDKAARVEMTLLSRGPAVRAEASSTDQHSALDAAIDKLESRLRRASDRRRISHGQHSAHVPVRGHGRRARRPVVPDAADDGVPDATGSAESRCRATTARSWCARRPTRPPPMTLDQALHEMELVGHDFYLFMEKDSMRPSVVYLRKGYDYGVIHLDVEA